MLPADRPRQTLGDVQEWLAPHIGAGRIGTADKVLLVGKRGYYARTMGPTAGNDRGIYDDALFIVAPDHFTAWNANVDPSITRPGVAVLKPGVWHYKPGPHGVTFNRPGYPYPAFVQADAVTVARDGKGDDTGWFGINIHRGSKTTTSSLGCQTLPPAQWDLFRDTLKAQLTRHGQKTFRYVLIG